MNELELISSYYPMVDASTFVDGPYLGVDAAAVQAICTLFAPDAIYDRQGHPPHVGVDAIETFFTTLRSLTGAHHIESIQCHEGLTVGEALRADRGAFADADAYKTVVVKGHFSGFVHVTDAGGGRLIKQTHPAELDFDDY
jgi:hypothetical protein